jgi:hypothetical protein
MSWSSPSTLSIARTIALEQAARLLVAGGEGVPHQQQHAGDVRGVDGAVVEGGHRDGLLRADLGRRGLYGMYGREEFEGEQRLVGVRGERGAVQIVGAAARGFRPLDQLKHEGIEVARRDGVQVLAEVNLDHFGQGFRRGEREKEGLLKSLVLVPGDGHERVLRDVVGRLAVGICRVVRQVAR